MEIILYELPNYAYNKYKKHFDFRYNLTHSIAQKEISRNIALGKLIYTVDNQEIYMFSDMKIRVNTFADGGRIVTGLWFNCRPDYNWRLNHKKLSKLNKKLGLGDVLYA